MPIVPNWSLGDKHLLENVPELNALVKKYSPCTLQPKSKELYFLILMKGLLAQQLPPEVTEALYEKLKLTFNPVTPEKIVAATDKELLSLGLVQQKIDYSKNFSHMVLTNSITLDKFDDMTDAEIAKQLLPVKGLGQWTIEMFLLVVLCRQDVVPTADYNFAKSLQTIYKLDSLPKKGQINKLAEPWKPWRSLGVWYLWKYFDEINSKKIKSKK